MALKGLQKGVRVPSTVTTPTEQLGVIETQYGEAAPIVETKPTIERLKDVIPKGEMGVPVTEYPSRQAAVEAEIASRSVPAPAQDFRQDTRPTSQQDMARQVEREMPYDATPLVDLDLSSVEGFRSDVFNRRKEQLSILTPEQKENKHEGLSATDTENLFASAANTANSMMKNPIITVDDTPYTAMDLVDNLGGQQVDPFAIGMAAEVATTVTLDNIQKYKMMDQAENQRKEIMDETIPFVESTTDLPEGVVETTISQAKGQAFGPEGRGGHEYGLLHTQAADIGKSMLRMVGAKDPDSDPSNQAYYAALGEAMLQQAVDSGEAKIYAMTDKVGRKRYFAQLTPRQDRSINHNSKIHSARMLNEVTDPGADKVSLGSIVATTSKGNLGAMPKTKASLDSIFEGDVNPDETYLSVLGGVAQEVDTEVLGVVTELLKRAEAGDQTALAYFKLDDTNTAAIKKKATERITAIFKADGRDLNNPNVQTELNHRVYMEVSNTIKYSMNKNKRDLELLRQMIDDNPETNPEHWQDAGKHRFAEWQVSVNNNRAQEKSRDMQSDSKAIIRTVLAFAEKAYVTKQGKRTPAEMMKVANKLQNIFYKGNRARDGMQSLKMLDTLSPQEQQEMSRMAMFARLFLKMADGIDVPRHQYYGGSSFIKPSIKRMSPAELVKYYALNEEVILKTLGPMALKSSEYVANPSSIPTTFQEGSMEKHLFERGEAGYNISQLRDVANWINAAEGGVVQLSGILEIDANNSNVAIQSIKTGNLNGASVLAFDVKGVHPDKWFDSDQDYESFYDVIYDEVTGNNSPIKSITSDEHQQDALMDAFKSLASKEVAGRKGATRHVIVAGFYGLHPSVNGTATQDLLAMLQQADSATYDKLLATYGGKPSAVKAAFQDMYGAVYQQSLGKISISKDVQKMGMALAMAGNYAFNIVSDTGATIRVGAGDLQPEGELQWIAHDEASGGMLKPQPKRMTYKDKDGNELPFLYQRDVTDYEIERTRVDENGELMIADKKAGQGFGQSLAALITHTLDASLQKVAILAQNMGRKVAMPNTPIHDANKLNAVSYLHHWVAYNNVATVAMASEKNTFKQIYDIAMKAKDEMFDRANKAAAQNKMMAVGTGPDVEYRAIFGTFDYYAEQVAQFNIKENNELRKTNSGLAESRFKRYERNLNILREAAENGWKPRADSGLEGLGFDMDNTAEDRKFVVVKPIQFKNLITLGYQINDMALTKKEQSRHGVTTPIQDWLNSMDKQQDALIDAISRGDYRYNSQN
jgi:hypothetical protein